MSTWTPGPIRFRRILKHGWVEYDFITDDSDGPGTYAIARFYGKNHEADARLWAQAPAMAEVLRALVDRATYSDPPDDTWTIQSSSDGVIAEARAILRAIEEG